MFFIYPGYFVVPREVKTVLMQNLFSGGAEGKLRYILGNRKSSSGELLNEIVVTEGNLGTSFSSQDAKTLTRAKNYSGSYARWNAFCIFLTDFVLYSVT